MRFWGAVRHTAARGGSANSAGFLVLLVLLVALLSWPLALTDRGMGQDFVNHLWYIWRQGVTIGRDHAPSLFLHDGLGLYYPHYAFYGGTIYAIAGGLSALLGQAPVKAYVITYLAGFAMALGGWVWLARLAGLRGVASAVPGIVFVTSAYYLTDIYARGTWPEFLAISAIPLLAAAAVCALLEQRLRGRTSLLLILSSMVLFGSHNITMLWGSTFLLTTAILAALFIPQARAMVTMRGVLAVVIGVIQGALINAWFLFPAIAYGNRIGIASIRNDVTLKSTDYIVDLSNLLTLSRHTVVSDAPGFAVALPLPALIWLLAVIPLAALFVRSSPWKRVATTMVAVTFLWLILTCSPGLLADLPRPFPFVQFSYRLVTYVLMTISGLLIAILALLTTAPLWLKRLGWGGLTVAVAIATVGAAQQVRKAPKTIPDRNVVFRSEQQPPGTLYGLSDYNDTSLPLVDPKTAETVIFGRDGMHHDEIFRTVAAGKPGELIRTDLLGAPYFVAVEGMKVIGRAADGHIVLRRPPDADGPVRVELRPASTWPLQWGPIVSLLSLLASLGIIAVATWRTRSSATQAIPVDVLPARRPKGNGAEAGRKGSSGELPDER